MILTASLVANSSPVFHLTSILLGNFPMSCMSTARTLTTRSLSPNSVSYAAYSANSNRLCTQRYPPSKPSSAGTTHLPPTSYTEIQSCKPFSLGGNISSRSPQVPTPCSPSKKPEHLERPRVYFISMGRLTSLPSWTRSYRLPSPMKILLLQN